MMLEEFTVNIKFIPESSCESANLAKTHQIEPYFSKHLCKFYRTPTMIHNVFWTQKGRKAVNINKKAVNLRHE